MNIEELIDLIMWYDEPVVKDCRHNAAEIVGDYLKYLDTSDRKDKTPKVITNEKQRNLCEHKNTVYNISYDSTYCKDCKKYIS